MSTPATDLFALHAQNNPDRPAVIEAHTGTHTLPGRDRLVPAYPGMRSVTR